MCVANDVSIRLLYKVWFLMESPVFLVEDEIISPQTAYSFYSRDNLIAALLYIDSTYC